MGTISNFIQYYCKGKCKLSETQRIVREAALDVSALRLRAEAAEANVAKSTLNRANTTGAASHPDLLRLIPNKVKRAKELITQIGDDKDAYIEAVKELLKNEAGIDMNSKSFKLVQKGLKRDNELLRIYKEQPNLFINLPRVEQFNCQRLLKLEPGSKDQVASQGFKHLTSDAFLGLPIKTYLKNAAILNNNLCNLLDKVYPTTANLRANIAQKNRLLQRNLV